jgi:hypothetical protein
MSGSAVSSTLASVTKCPKSEELAAQAVLDWRSALTMIVFLGINACVVHPFTVSVPGW